MSTQALDKIRADLALLIRQEGLPVGVFWGRGSQLLADEQGLVHSNHGTGAPLLETLSLSRLAFLAERGVRGDALDRELNAMYQRRSHYLAAPPIDDAGYASIVARLAAAADSPRQEGVQRILDDTTAAARVAKTLVGRVVSEPYADGAAMYLITDVTDDKVRLRTLPIGDAWTIPYWGEDAWVARPFIEAKVQMADATDPPARRLAGARP